MISRHKYHKIGYIKKMMKTVTHHQENMKKSLLIKYVKMHLIQLNIYCKINNRDLCVYNNFIKYWLKEEINK